MTSSATPQLRAPRPGAGDLVLALAVTVVLAAVVTIATAAAGAPVSPLAYVFAAGFGAVLLVRRRVPVVVLVVSVLGTFVYYTLGLPTIGVALPVVAAVFSAAERGRLRAAVLAAAVVLVVAMLFRVRDDPQPLASLLGSDAVTNAALLAAAIGLGAAARARTEQARQARQIAALREERARQEQLAALRAERERISRELHDTVGHSLSVIALHSGVAADALDAWSGDAEDRAGAAVAQVRAQTSASLRELRTMVGLLREEDGAETRTDLSLASLPALLEGARAAGLTVRAAVEPGDGALPAAVETAVYRIVQEAVTNTLRHARADTLEVEVRRRGEELHVAVRDDGRGGAAAGPPGTGLVGMAERVRLLGGTLRTGAAGEGGFTVEAVLPVQLPPAAPPAPEETS